MRLSIKGKIYTPDKFIDIANESGEIVNLTMIMINEVFKVVNNHNINVAINITPQDLRSDIITFLKEKISEYSINPEKINLELLENEDFYELEDRIIELKDLGFKISLDDFGSGFSNFSKLISMKIDFLKIDGSIIKNIHCDENTFQIVKNINEIGKTLGCKTIAEYVSSAEIFSKVIDIGIDYSQGYFFYKPSPKIT
jgi:EAL domain-containing protein (putative c-di-GMP-specific phosphodiesterase class I)